VTPEASGIRLEYCAVAYSTFGLDIESAATPVSLREVVFRHSGTASITRERRTLSLRENLPVSFAWPETAAATQPAKPAAWKGPVRITGAVAAVAGGALWLTGHLRAEHFNSLMIRPGTPLTTGNDYKDTRDSWVTVRNLGIGLFGLVAAGFVVTFVF
jgi:hypothetical protein